MGLSCLGLRMTNSLSHSITYLIWPLSISQSAHHSSYCLQYLGISSLHMARFGICLDFTTVNNSSSGLYFYLEIWDCKFDGISGQPGKEMCIACEISVQLQDESQEGN